jgi:hypothetical protein
MATVCLIYKSNENVGSLICIEYHYYWWRGNFISILADSLRDWLTNNKILSRFQVGLLREREREREKTAPYEFYS